MATAFKMALVLLTASCIPAVQGWSTTSSTYAYNVYDYFDGDEAADNTIKFERTNSYTTSAEFTGSRSSISPGGTSVSLSDDSYQYVALGWSFPFAGSYYSGIYIGSNGYITLSSGSTAHSNTLSNFVSHRRIAGCFMDLNPAKSSCSGQVGYDNDGDSITVVWYQVCPFSSSYSGTATFSIKLEDDGDIKFKYNSLTSAQMLWGVSNQYSYPTNANLSTSGGETVGLVVGIIIGCVAAAIAIGAAIYCCWKRNRNKHHAGEQDPPRVPVQIPVQPQTVMVHQPRPQPYSAPPVYAGTNPHAPPPRQFTPANNSQPSQAYASQLPLPAYSGPASSEKSDPGSHGQM
eukprot:TRINITY_DN48835_c0_g1_i3.p1 TRINITY_DN48835_c0_g1~~TRINITY_DN48835_c0_g1_i3.p1  ORF type:complete len:346 (+),score=44.47 TRINITY_DN48835_c0_g1_i3:183-1220(+)